MVFHISETHISHAYGGYQLDSLLTDRSPVVFFETSLRLSFVYEAGPARLNSPEQRSRKARGTSSSNDHCNGDAGSRVFPSNATGALLDW